jgi:hypothetical protein
MATGTAGGDHTNRRGNSSHGGGVFTAHPTPRSFEGLAKVDGLSNAVCNHSGSGFMRRFPYLWFAPPYIVD